MSLRYSNGSSAFSRLAPSEISVNGQYVMTAALTRVLSLVVVTAKMDHCDFSSVSYPLLSESRLQNSSHQC